MDMKKSIVLGNGINRCVMSDVAWGDLLSQIAEKYSVHINRNISFPMQFETLVNQVLVNRKTSKNDIYNEIKQDIISQLETATSSLSIVAPHKALADTSDSIITTNYDFLIEHSIDDNFSIKNVPAQVSNNKYNLQNMILVAEKEVFHIHGDIRRSQSICLGYEHYVGTVQHLRSAIATKKDFGKEKVPAIVLALREPKTETNVWAEKLFTDDVHIVGLGLTPSEIDIWWLITYRASLFSSNRYGCRELIKNKIVYHDIGNAQNEDMKFTLENLCVEYTFHSITKKDENFLQKYIEISNMI